MDLKLDDDNDGFQIAVEIGLSNSLNVPGNETKQNACFPFHYLHSREFQIQIKDLSVKI